MSVGTMTPREIVQELDKHVIGQDKAKRSVAIALRNRWRRQQLDDALRPEVTPKNILMIGPTGVGKTEIARRLAKLANAPFIKVEATKFTEVGYVGKEVDSIIRDLADMAMKMMREQEVIKVKYRATEAAEERILDILLPAPRKETPVNEWLSSGDDEPAKPVREDSVTRQKFRKKLREGELDDKEIELDVSVGGASVEIMTPPGMEEMASQSRHVPKPQPEQKAQTQDENQGCAQSPDRGRSAQNGQRGRAKATRFVCGRANRHCVPR